MPKGQALELEIFKQLVEVEVKKESETTRTALLTPNSEKRFRLLGFVLGASAETAVTLEDGTAAFFGLLIPAKTTLVINLATLPTSGYLSAGAGNKLQFKSLNTAKFSGAFYGIEDVS